MQKFYCKITIATFMQPFQWDLRCSAAKDNSITHTAVMPEHLDAAVTMRSEITSPTRISLRTWQSDKATFMQPFHCDLQPKIQEPHRTTYIRRSSHCRTQRRNQKTSKRSDPHPPHTRGTFHRRPEPLYTEKHTVSCPNYPPKRSPCNIHAAITMRFATSRHKNVSLSPHMATPHGNSHAAIPLRSATKDSRTA